MGRGDQSRRARVGWAAVYVLLTAIPVAVVVVLAVVVVPPVARNLTSERVAVDVHLPLTSDAATARVRVPAGWVLQLDPWDASAFVVRTPDGILSVDVQVRDEGFERVDLGEAGAAVTETLASGLSAAHRIGGSELHAAVGAAGVASAVELRATTAAGADLTAYLPSLALLLEGVELAP